MMVEYSLVSVLDDDMSVRESLPDLLRELGYAATAFSLTEECLASDSKDHTDRLLLDITIAGNVRTRSAKRVDASRAKYSDHLYHRRQARAHNRALTQCSAVSLQAIVSEPCFEHFIPSSSQVEP